MAHHACQPSVSSLVEVKERIAYHPQKPESEGLLFKLLEGEYRLFHFTTIGSQSHYVEESVYYFWKNVISIMCGSAKRKPTYQD
ncbi:MAG: hypothetical protein R2788_06065 [Saprospiraceae bacterium]